MSNFWGDFLTGKKYFKKNSKELQKLNEGKRKYLFFLKKIIMSSKYVCCRNIFNCLLHY